MMVFPRERSMQREVIGKIFDGAEIRVNREILNRDYNPATGAGTKRGTFHVADSCVIQIGMCFHKSKAMRVGFGRIRTGGYRQDQHIGTQ
ncbi:hypothetical protein LS482_10775 [Sinomicrobium kalidii]|nr:hypothetical protein [Sinomicrobium kalidii]UGU14196.1 hypothetical protein LS482_10775 [Sinomicrobium kalidii]